MTHRYLYIFYTSTILLTCCSLMPNRVNNTNQLKADSIGAIQSLQQSMGSQDSLIFEKLMQLSKNQNWEALTMDSIMIKVAAFFMDVPYVAATLEINETEQLVVNLREMDCTTFVENVLALTRCINQGKTGQTDYLQTLTNIRYRNGVIDQYPSRLHYFTEWLINNSTKGIIDVVSEKFGTDTFSPMVSFMSENPDKYKALNHNPTFIEPIAKAEKEISTLQFKYIPKEKLLSVENKIVDGDIIAITTNINGLDIAHVGIAINQNNRLHMIHASLTLKKVVVTQEPLTEYLAGIKRQTGIIVARPVAD